ETPANFATSCKVTRLLLRRFFLIKPVPAFFVIIASLQLWLDTAMVLLEHAQRSLARHSEDLVGMQSSFPAAKCYWVPLRQPRLLQSEVLCAANDLGLRPPGACLPNGRS